MPPPCRHASAVPGCRLCHLYVTDERYRKKWDAPPAPGRRALHRADATPCRHLGPVIGDTPCGSCGMPGKRGPLHACAVHGRCTVESRSNDHDKGVPWCRVCPDREAAASACAACSLPEPLPGAQVVPTGAAGDAWSNRPDVIKRHKEALARVVASGPASPPGLTGDGLVLCGEGKYWPGIVVACKLLREIGSSLPVQVWHQADVDAADLAGLDVRLIDVREYRKSHPPRVMGGWEVKSYALLHSGFRRALYLDADAYCVADPAPLFALLEHAPFVFWADFPSSGSKLQWAMNGVDALGSPPTIQGGQLLIDMAAWWRELALSHWINQHSDYFFRHQYGDQDSWRIALAATGGPYLCLGRARWDAPAFVCEHAGRPFIVHRCQGKLLLPWQGPPSVVNPRLPLESRAHEITASLVGEASRAFGAVYKSGLWAGGELSGTGSDDKAAAPYLAIVNRLIRDTGARRVVDLGCGDGRVLRGIQAPERVGVDVHSPHVGRLKREAPEIEWVRADLDLDRDKLPEGDIALVKDVLQHWPSETITSWLDWARRCGRWKRIILTNDRRQDVADCMLGGHRGLDPALSPLRDVQGLRPVATYLHKAVCVLECSPLPAREVGREI